MASRSTRQILWVVALAVSTGAGAAARAAGQGSSPAPVQMTREEDHARTMKLLGLTEMPRGAASASVENVRNRIRRPIRIRSCPIPVVLKNGKKVTTAAAWRPLRRDPRGLRARGLRAAAEEHAQGHLGGEEHHERHERGCADRHERTGRARGQLGVPAGHRRHSIDVEHAGERHRAGAGHDAVRWIRAGPGSRRPRPCRCSGRRCSSRAGHRADRPGAPATGPAPAGAAAPPAGAAAGGRGPSGPTWQQQVLARGWGYATIAPNSIQADNGAGLTAGIIGLVNKGQPRKLDDWGSLSAWGWGASRALDYFETDKAVDAKRVGIQGHSRYGKAALVTMALDERFAIGYISSSGAGGAKLHRRKFGEVVENVAGISEYHWMAGNYLKYAGNWNALPVDSHELIALCAPAPGLLECRARRRPQPGRHHRADQRRLGRREGQLSRRRWRRAGLSAARQEGPRHDRVPGHRHDRDRRRPRLPPAHGRTHRGTDLADVPDLRRQVLRGVRPCEDVSGAIAPPPPGHRLTTASPCLEWRPVG